MTILYILSLIAAKGVKMLNYIWSGLIAVSVLCALFMGNTADISNALIESGASSIQLILTMAGIICLWSGIMKIAVESGLTNIFAKLFIFIKYFYFCKNLCTVAPSAFSET